MDWRFFGRDETRAHVHTLRAHGERCDQRTTVCLTARRHEWNVQLIRSAREQDHVRDIIFTWVTTALKAINRDGITANILRLQRVAHRRTLVDDFNPCILEIWQHFRWVTASRLDDFNTAIDHSFHDCWIIWWIKGRQERDVHAKWLVCHVAAFRDLIREICRGLLGQTCNDA